MYQENSMNSTNYQLNKVNDSNQELIKLKDKRIDNLLNENTQLKQKKDTTHK